MGIICLRGELLGPMAQIKETDQENAVVIMAGGIGTRLRPLTLERPKPLLNIGNKAILQIIIDNFANFGFKNIYLSVNYKADMVKDYFKDGSEFGVKIKYLHESKKLGTAGSLSLLNRKKIDKPIFVMNGDLLTNVNFKKFLQYHNAHGAMASLAVKEYEYQVPYGVINMLNNYEIASIVEKPSYNFTVNAGIYILNPEVLDFVADNESLDMPVLINELLESKQKVSSFPIHDHYFDIGEIEEYERANESYKEVS